MINAYLYPSLSDRFVNRDEGTKFKDFIIKSKIA